MGIEDIELIHITGSPSPAAVKRAAYDDVMKEQPKSTSAPRWVWHRWDHDRDRLRTTKWIGSIPRPTADYHREGSIQEIEQRENAGQREMFA